MSIVFDIVVVFIIIASIYGGYKKGIVDVGYRLVAIILSLLISAILYTPITYFIVNNTQIDEKIEEVIIKNAISNVEKNDNQNNNINDYLQSYAKDAMQGTQNAVVEASAKPIALNIIRIGVMIVLFLLTRVILVILKIFTNIITKIPILKQCNEIVGLVYGIIRGLVIVYGILAILYFVITMGGAESVKTVIDSSYVTKFLFYNNLILSYNSQFKNL